MNDREQLNQLGEQWYSMPKEGNEAARLALCEKIFVLAYQLFPRQRDAMGLFFEQDWPKFEPGKGDLYGFMSYRLERRKRDMDRQDFNSERREETDEATREKKKVNKRLISLDAPAGEDGAARGDAATGSPDVDDSRIMFDERVLEMITLMLDLKSRLGGRAGNPKKINYYRLFFTDGVVDAIHSQGAELFARRERDLFRAIKVTFLNYFMRRPCGCVEDILDTDLKLYGQMVEGRPMETPKQPLPNDVYTTYLKQVEKESSVGPSAVSQQRTAYRAFMREQLLC